MPCAENVESEATAGEDDEVDPGSRDAPSGFGGSGDAMPSATSWDLGEFGEGSEQGRKGLEMGRGF